MAQRRYRHKGSGLASRLGLTPRRGVIVALVALAGLIAVVIAAVSLGSASSSFEVARVDAATSTEMASTPSASTTEAPATTSAPVERVCVHVDGAVVAPGVYDLEGESLRIRDAVAAAGGLVEGADTSQINLAEPITDGQKVHVPLEGEEAVSQPATGSEASGSSSSSGASAATTSSGVVNINTATIEELDTLPGVGESTAQAIIKDRDANGAFTSPEDIMRVSGIAEKKYEKIKDLICV